MLQNFEVIQPLLEGHPHERLQFKINIAGNDYRGLYYNEEVQWFHPQPHSNLKKEDINAIEDHIHNLLS